MATAGIAKAGGAKRANAAARSAAPAPARAGWERLRHLIETGRVGANSYVVLLGVETFDSPQLLRALEQGLPYRAFERLLANMEMAAADVLALLDIPPRTLTRRKREGRFHRDESDRLLRASRILARALKLFEGDREAAKHWLAEPQRALGGAVPLTVARTETGALEVERLIGRLEHGVFT